MRDQKQWEKDKGFPEKSDAFLRRYRGKFPLLMQEILVKRPKKSNRKASSRKNRLDLLYCSDDCIVEDGFTYSNSNIDGKTTWKLLPNSKSEKNCDSCGKPIAKKMTQDSDEKILLIQRVLQKRIDEHCIDDKHLPYHEYGIPGMFIPARRVGCKCTHTAHEIMKIVSLIVNPFVFVQKKIKKN